MNVIVIVADTWRRDHMGCYAGKRIRTPHLDEFAETAAVFENCYFGSYPTLPCRNDIITGKYEFPWRGWAGPDGESLTLSGLVSGSGRMAYFITDVYHHWWGRGGGRYWWDFTGFDIVRGQERDGWITDTDVKIRCPAPEYEGTPRIKAHLRNARFVRNREEDWFAAQVFSRAARWIRHNSARENFFLMVDSFDPHEPWDPPRKYADMYDDPEYDGHEHVSPTYGRVDGYLTPAEFKHVQALYAGEVTMVDRWLGQLLLHVRKRKLMDRTMIIVTTDHGTYNGDHGLVGKNDVLYQGLAHVPMIVWHPELGHGKRISQLVQPVDIFPTVLEAVGLDVPDDVHGRSLIRLLEKGDEAEWRDTALFGQHETWCNLTDGRYVLHRGLASGQTMLFDLSADPGEETNLAESKPKELARMQKLLAAKLKGINAPAGFIEKLTPAK